jgi:hypothetical protein
MVDSLFGGRPNTAQMYTYSSERCQERKASRAKTQRRKERRDIGEKREPEARRNRQTTPKPPQIRVFECARRRCAATRVYREPGTGIAHRLGGKWCGGRAKRRSPGTRTSTHTRWYTPPRMAEARYAGADPRVCPTISPYGAYTRRGDPVGRPLFGDRSSCLIAESEGIQAGVFQAEPEAHILRMLRIEGDPVPDPIGVGMELPGGEAVP